ncbi:hypothetical protein EVAR_63049_1 [Eumeta japonica]|uniref:Uncharacterized protein n=1 Tax=Eumeta variegata TaxID=151549 RepID=A0A4C1Z8F1_EUMVA|nr:hypothetical protein EVAR_63049_1 [Eumeta japonica]
MGTRRRIVGLAGQYAASAVLRVLEPMTEKLKLQDALRVNLGGSKVATRELPDVARGLGLSIVLVPHCGESNVLQVDQEAKAGILLCMSDMAVSLLAHLFRAPTPVAPGPPREDPVHPLRENDQDELQRAFHTLVLQLSPVHGTRS